MKENLSPFPPVRPLVAALPSYIAGRKAPSTLTAALASNESHFEPLPSVMETIRDQAAQINRYPDMASVDLRAAIAARLDVSSDEIAVGTGSTGVLQQILAATCEPEDEVIFAWRSFEAYPILTTIAGAKSVAVPLLPDEHHDLDAMADAVTDKTRVIILCSPNNPTGSRLGSARVEGFLDKVPERVLVVIDEAYVEFQDDIDEVDALGLYRNYPNICVLRTFSKAYGLAGLRVGYAVARTSMADGLRKTAIPFGVNRMAQSAAVASLAAHNEMRERVAHVRIERQRMLSALRSLGWTVPESQANFIWLRCGDDVREHIMSALTDADILVRGYADDGVRISLADHATNNRVLHAIGNRTNFGGQ